MSNEMKKIDPRIVDSTDEIVCVLRFNKEQFLKKGIQAHPLETEFRWNGNRVAVPGGGSCSLIQTMLKVSL